MTRAAARPRELREPDGPLPDHEQVLRKLSQNGRASHAACGACSSSSPARACTSPKVSAPSMKFKFDGKLSVVNANIQTRKSYNRHMTYARKKKCFQTHVDTTVLATLSHQHCRTRVLTCSLASYRWMTSAPCISDRDSSGVTKPRINKG